jgi:hypothetical protein
MKAHTRFVSVATVILALMVVISLTGCGGPKTYTKYKFSLEYPSSISIDSGNLTTSTEAVHLTSNDYDARVNVFDAGSESLLGLEEFEKTSITSDTDKTNIKDQATTMGGQPAMQISYNSGDSDTDQVLFTIKDGKEYELDVSGSTDSPKASNPFEKMKASFKFL